LLFFNCQLSLTYLFIFVSYLSQATAQYRNEIVNHNVHSLSITNSVIFIFFITLSFAGRVAGDGAVPQ
jgi:hypothetical protein